jgi:hypothetical protein
MGRSNSRSNDRLLREHMHDPVHTRVSSDGKSRAKPEENLMRAYVVDNHDASRSWNLQSVFRLESRVAGGRQAVMNEEVDLNQRAKQRR